MGRVRRTFSDEVKRKAVDDYVSGRKSAADVASELQINENMIYRWRAIFEAEASDARVEELVSEGSSVQQARRIQQLEATVAEYQKKLGEMALIQDLLKKRLHSTTSQQWNELTGLIETLERSARKRERVK